IYMVADGLGQYIFNTDNDFEYIMLVKRKMPGDVALSEELLIASPEKGVINTFTAEEGKGAIRSVLMMSGSNPELIVVYMTDDYKYTADAYSLPFSKFAGGSGTSSDPYLIATAGDLQQIKTAPGAYFKLTSDIDCCNLDFYPIEEFNGTLDGDGHTVSNLKLVTRNNSKTGIFNFTNQATVKNINFYNAKMLLSGAYEAGLIAATSGNSKFENIHVHRLSATGNSYGGEFGGIVGKMWTMSAISGCEVAGADIDLPSCPSAGGITGDIRTGCTITGCAFSGNMTAHSTLGGIVGSTTTGDEVISQCHVDANLKAENTVGGIVGFLDRSKVKNNYVEGTIEATKPSKWNKAVSLGGIAGELEGDWQRQADIPVENNLIGLSAFIYPDMSGMTEDFPRQLSTVHRVVGRTSYNNFFEEEPEKIVYETGVQNNLIVTDIKTIDQEFAEKTVEGTTTDKNEITIEMLKESLDFGFGTSSDTPWNIKSWYAYDPSLYYESIAYIPTSEITVGKGKSFFIEIAILSREELTEEELMGSFMCEFNEQILEMTGNMKYDGKTLGIEFKALEEGTADFTVSILSGNAGCKVNVVEEGSAVDSIVSDTSIAEYARGVITANGCEIAVYDINGKLMMSGNDKIDTKDLSSGVYVATAIDNNGKKQAIKFVK
ncbi:MAG: T9SS type A sorting domain-containing protein, partial [Muribaculaceae bacterium]|nr:T9SS type A sorting domain-containing protein [Muribaculaceae bacterium]